MAASNATTRTLPSRRIIQNFHLIWLDGSIDCNNDDYHDSITKLREIINTVNTFVDVDECVDYINNTKEESAFMITSGFVGQTVVPMIHSKQQVTHIYIFCQNKARHEKWAKEWPKVKGVFTDIKSICEALKQAAQYCDHNAVSISFSKHSSVDSSVTKDILDCSFMYTQILKDILLDIHFTDEHIKNFLTYSGNELADNTVELRNIDRIQNEYNDHQPIWWYTYESFLYSMLNRALRLMDVDIIVRMGFFLRDVHNHIAALYFEQFNGHTSTDSFVVYRGQTLSQRDFDQLKENSGGLLAFNNFLSTSENRRVSLQFVQHNVAKVGSVNILFVMHIDPSIQGTPFANVDKVSAVGGEEEVLFSMHAVFRIGQMKKITDSTEIWQVELVFTSDNDPQLRSVTEKIQEETKGSTGWKRLGILLIKLARLDKAEDLYNMLLKQTNDQHEKSILFHQLARIYDDQGRYAEAIRYYEKSFEIMKEILPANHLDIATYYGNIGLVYYNMSEYSKALEYYEKSLTIREKVLPEDHPDMAQSYNSIGLAYQNMGKYSKALEYYQKSTEIFQKTLPANHPLLATSYNNTGLVYDNMAEYSKALQCHEKAVEIREKTLPENHPDIAQSYNNIGLVYSNIREYPRALRSYEKSIEIYRKTLSANHPSLATSYNNIGLVYNQMQQYSKALEYYGKALEIRVRTLPATHSSLATSYNNVGLLYYNMHKYSKALEYYEKSLDIRKKTLSENHPNLAQSYNNIGLVYQNMSKYSKALEYYERALHIVQCSLPANHSTIKNVQQNIQIVKKKL